jgi:hypothetical protein
MSDPNDFQTLSPEQAAALPPLRDVLEEAFKNTSDRALGLAGTGVFHLAGQPKIDIDSVRRGYDPATTTIVPIVLDGVPGGPVYVFHLTGSDVRRLMMALLKAQE